MNCWRAIIGCIGPIGEIVQTAFAKWAPTGVGFDTVGLWFPGPTPEGLKLLGEQLEDAAKRFKYPGAMNHKHNVVLFGCTSGSCIKGYGYDLECMEVIEKNSGWPALTTVTACLEAFAALGSKKLVLVTPYPDATNELERKFLEDNGYEVVATHGIGFNWTGPNHAPDELFLYRSLREIDMSGADTLFLSCMALETMNLVKLFEEDFKINVVTSHQASFWGCLRHSGIRDKIPELGKLLAI